MTIYLLLQGSYIYPGVYVHYINVWIYLNTLNMLIFISDLYFSFLSIVLSSLKVTGK